MKKFILNQEGVTLAEILVTMGIIAVLMTITVPLYNKHRARALRAEGIQLLNDFFISAQAARGEFGRYPGNMVQTGFAPVGNLNYRFHNDNNPAMPGSTPMFDFACEGTAHPCNCAGGGSRPCPNFKTWREKMSVNGSIGATTVNPWHTNTCAGLPSTTISSDNRFSARVAGRIRGGGDKDVWGIDENKNLRMCNDGVH